MNKISKLQSRFIRVVGQKKKTKVLEKEQVPYQELKEKPIGPPLSTTKKEKPKSNQPKQEQQPTTPTREFSLEDYGQAPEEFLEKSDFVMSPAPTEDIVKRTRKDEIQKKKKDELQKSKPKNELAIPRHIESPPFLLRGEESPEMNAELLEKVWSYLRQYGASEQDIDKMKKKYRETGSLDVAIRSQRIPGLTLKIILEDLEEGDRDESIAKIEKYLRLLRVPKNIIQNVIKTYKETGSLDITSLPVDIRPYFIDTKRLTSQLRRGIKMPRSEEFFLEAVVSEAKKRFPILKNYEVIIPDSWEEINDDKYFPSEGEADVVDKNGKVVGKLTWTVGREEWKSSDWKHPRTYVQTYISNMGLTLNKGYEKEVESCESCKDKTLHMLRKKIRK